MERLLDKIIVLLGCCMALPFLEPISPEVAGMLLAITASALFEVAPSHLRLVGIAVFFALALVEPAYASFAPLAIYDCTREVARTSQQEAAAHMAHTGGLALTYALGIAALLGSLPRLPLPACACALICSAVAVVLAWRTSRLLANDAQQRMARDSMREQALALEARNRDLRDKQDYEVHVATLRERGRIAREIHDNVGHLLTRAVLQVEAMQVVHAQNEQITRELAPVGATLSEALASVRASVHALHDDALDLEGQVRECARRCGAAGIIVEVDYAIDDAPAPVALCFAAITREALANVMRHSNATTVVVRLAEYPALFQITVTDDGGCNACSESADTGAGTGGGVGAGGGVGSGAGAGGGVGIISGGVGSGASSGVGTNTGIISRGVGSGSNSGNSAGADVGSAAGTSSTSSISTNTTSTGGITSTNTSSSGISTNATPFSGRSPDLKPKYDVGIGLQSMEERVIALGGTFRAGPRERGGFRVFASIPKAVPKAVPEPITRPIPGFISERTPKPIPGSVSESIPEPIPKSAPGPIPEPAPKPAPNKTPNRP